MPARCTGMRTPRRRPALWAALLGIVGAMAAIDASWLAQFDAHTLRAVGELVLIALVPIALITVGAGVLARHTRLSWGQTAVVCLLPVGILEAAILSFIARIWLVGHLDLLVF